MKKQNRFIFTLQKLGPVFLRYQLHHKDQDSEAFKNTCVAIRETFQELGPTYIKLGQLLSARPDIVGVTLATELRNLLDSEPIIPFEQIEQLLEQTWGKEIKTIVRKVEHTPLATASIAQVHKATMHNGHVVAIKIQRPGIAESIKKDLAIFKRITWVLDKTIAIKGLKFSYIYQEFAEWITTELDFQVEGRRADKFRENMKDLSTVTIPTIFWEHSTERILVMSYVDGLTINDMLHEMQQQKVKSMYDVHLPFAFDPDLMIHHLIEAVAQQLFVDKYFHGDLHPANVFLQKKNTIGFVDFGIVGTLNSEEHTHILLALLAVVEGDPQAMVKIISSLIAEPLKQQDIAELHQIFADELHRLHEDENGKISLNHFVTVLLGMSQKYSFMWSSGFLLAVKSIGQIDTLCQLVGLKTSLVEILRPHVNKAVTASLKSALSKEEIFKSLLDLLDAGKKLPQTLNQLEDIINTQSLPVTQAK